jgi:hypothetical protein
LNSNKVAIFFFNSHSFPKIFPSFTSPKQTNRQVDRQTNVVRTPHFLLNERGEREREREREKEKRKRRKMRGKGEQRTLITSYRPIYIQS